LATPLRPKRGGFLRPFGCAWFVRECLAGHSPHGAPPIDPKVGAVQSDIFRIYKTALIKATAMDRAIREEELQARRDRRAYDPERIEALAAKHEKSLPFKSTGCRYHSFVVYFSNLRRLGWVKPSGRSEPSSFQTNFPDGPSRRYYRLTAAGKRASDIAWANPRLALYGGR
jgi:hypothetical protein